MLVITYYHIIRCIRSSCISACPIYCVHHVTGILHNSSLTRSHIITCIVVITCMVAVSLLTIRYLIILKSLTLILVLIKILALVIQHLALSLLDGGLALVTR